MSFAGTGDILADLDVAPQQQCFHSHKRIGQAWLETRNPFGKVWNQLIQEQRLFFLEIACSETSVSEEVNAQLGQNSSFRCAHWNGFDLTTSDGVSKIKQLIRERRPVHIWISCDCGPYSPLQRLNQRTEEQRQKLQEKREYALQEYLGAIEVAFYGRRHGCQIHWELSEKCEAWDLQRIQTMIHKLQLQKVTCHGCCVGLRAKDTGQLMCKGWSIATQNANLLRHMNLKRQRNHKKTWCESGRPLSSAFYTPVFAKKVVESLLEHEPWSLLSQEIVDPDWKSQDPLFDPEAVLVGDDALDQAEHGRILRKLQHIHSVTGHGSVQNLVKVTSEARSSRQSAPGGSTIQVYYMRGTQAYSK